MGGKTMSQTMNSLLFCNVDLRIQHNLLLQFDQV
jgi:hypothetical protein